MREGGYEEGRQPDLWEDAPCDDGRKNQAAVQTKRRGKWMTQQPDPEKTEAQHVFDSSKKPANFCVQIVKQPETVQSSDEEEEDEAAMSVVEAPAAPPASWA